MPHAGSGYRPAKDDTYHLPRRFQGATVHELALALLGSKCPEFRVLRVGLAQKPPRLNELNSELGRERLTVSQLEAMKSRVIETMGRLGHGGNFAAYLDTLIHSARLKEARDSI
jgi:hypothetical protein